MKHVPYSCELSYNSYVEAFIQNFKWETSLLVIWCSPICVVTPVRLQNKALFLSLLDAKTEDTFIKRTVVFGWLIKCIMEN